jgi:nicotinamide-nucleotide amidase
VSGLEEQLGTILRALGWSLAVAESCTGGLLASRITDVPGASDYFRGGVIAYQNPVKEQLLGVCAETLTRHGPVSEQTALEMARGCRRLFAAELSASITGIAGPGGGTAENPVGTVYIAVSGPRRDLSQRLHFDGERIENKAQSVDAALELCLQALKDPAE